MSKKFRKLILPASLLVALQANSLGLGSLQVNSALDETLQGKISLLIDDNDNTENIKVSIASSDEYEKVGLDKSYVPSNIVVNMEGEGNEKYISVSSKGPVSEPIVSLLLVVDWANGHLLREYTLLLDPPSFNSTQDEYSQPVETQTYTAQAPIENTETTTYTEPVTYTEAATTNTTSTTYSQAGEVVVESGDTLWQIANRHNSGSTSPQQMMVAIFNNNPAAFQNNDMNFLKKGAVLEIPNSDQVSMVSNGQAISEVKSHLQNWSRLQTSDTSNDNSSDSSSDYGIELVPPSDTDSQTTNNSSGLSNSKLKSELSQAKEELVSSNLENNELASRIAELEKIVEDQESVLSLKDTNLAQLQQQLTDVESTVEENVTEAVDDVWNNEETAGIVDKAEAVLENTTEVVEDIIDDTKDVVENLADDTAEVVEDVINDTDKVVDDTIEVVEDTTESTEISITDVAQETAPDVETQVTQPEISTQTREVSFMDKIMAYKTELMYGLGALLLALFGFMFMKRKDENDDSGDFLDSINNNDNDAFIADSNEENLDLSNLDENIDELEQDVEDIIEDVSGDVDEKIEDISDSLDDIEEPEVVMMDDDSSDDLEADDFDLEEIIDIDEGETDAIEDLNELEFNLDDDIEEISEEVEETVEELVEETDEDLSLDFVLDDLDLNDESEDLDVEEEKISEEQLLEDDLDLDLDITDEESDLDEVVDTNDELEELVFDTGEIQKLSEDSLDLDDDLLDLDDMDFGDDGLGIEDELTVEIDGSDEESVDIGLDFDDIIGDDAIDTKLDLAKAYFEMGDVDGANQMVDEIMEEGNAEQQSKAKELKSEIDG